uniref:DUF4939 domain-containing protein n=1 Tax=Amphiprion percula TaxID=161767 RepID=A0A3P8S613_AMPPE
MSSAGNAIEVDGVASITIQDAIANQGTTLGQHDDMLHNLALSNTALFNHLQHPLPVQEPYVPVPERYSGDFGSCQAFLTQPYSYATDRARIAYLVSLLSGDTRDWGTAVWQQQSALCHLYFAFVDEMKKIFDHPLAWDDPLDKL